MLARLPAERVPRVLAEHRSVLMFPMAIVVLLAFLPVIMVLLDDLRMQRAFPVLADFESVNELSRWDFDGISHFDLDRNQVRHGSQSLYVRYDSGRYPSVTLTAFPANWLGYDQLNLSVYNDQIDDLQVELKVFDRQHKKNGYHYNDRFISTGIFKISCCYPFR